MNLLDSIQSYLTQEVAPRANQLDRDPDALREVMDHFWNEGWMALKRPDRWGGPAMDEGDFRQFQQMVARASGALAFLQTQHQSAVSMIAKGDNASLMDRVLPGMDSGLYKVGIGFSQLRRPGPPLMRAELRPDGGLILNGHVPWVTGWTFYDEFLLGASLPDGRCTFCLVPLATGNGITVSPPMQLAAFEAAQTVTVDFVDYPVPPVDVAAIREGDFILRNDMINVSLQGHFAIGNARAGVDLVRAANTKRPNPALDEAAAKLEAEIDRCSDALFESDLPKADRLATRAWAIELAGRCAHAAVVAWGGAANSLDHPAQRVYREAIVFSVSAQTPDIMRATLERLTR
ncbi:MAG: acyl-CoA/acyl-ACP dehydrogenase [Armatimonadetes bacterium]|nr:acyl-CoA/acyl-ACP dehydrogenase [Armatimonadota bacterium]